MFEHAPSTQPHADFLRTVGTLTLRSERDGGTHRISPSGELDLATAPDLEAELLRVEATDADAIVLDLSGLDFIDSNGIRLVVMADARSRADSDRLALVRPSDGVFRVFVICGVADRLPFVDLHQP
jgi:anti-sigma B factor antagonist